MKFTNFKISRESIFPLDNIAHVRARKIFYHISAHFRNPAFRSVSKPRKPGFIFRTGPTTRILSGWGKKEELIKYMEQILHFNKVTVLHNKIYLLYVTNLTIIQRFNFMNTFPLSQSCISLLFYTLKIPLLFYEHSVI